MKQSSIIRTTFKCIIAHGKEMKSTYLKIFFETSDVIEKNIFEKIEKTYLTFVRMML